jgi:hypothetical protein
MPQRTTERVHQDITRSLHTAKLIASCAIFDGDPTLFARPYRAKSQVSAADFQLFVKIIEGSDPELTHENCPALELLGDEFKFTGLGDKVQAFTDRWTQLVFEGQTVRIERGKLVQMCRRFRDCGSLLTRPYHVTSSIGADIFRAFVNAIDGISPAITDGIITVIGLLCKEFGCEKLSATVSEFLAQHSSPGESACR